MCIWNACFELAGVFYASDILVKGQADRVVHRFLRRRLPESFAFPRDK
ncbi:hypothetical protein HM1_1495 [Heliomicrobium modesticaldum Ice1]|uniref:Uncharacterized protein n=1 Tax=Heliobacterium modesticaldum (strain ATCC 51547 / Ice1) TaxID=498761 RepID=B0TCP2_HELMI|nr:hypothetical protein HM1_1495 [Heliomicrobium modesticaldum Ice1]